MSEKHDSVENALNGTSFEPIRAMPCPGNSSLGFEGASTLVCDAYGDAIDDASLVAAERSFSSLVEDVDNLNLVDISLSRNATERTSVTIDLTAIQMQCCDLSLAVPINLVICSG